VGDVTIMVEAGGGECGGGGEEGLPSRAPAPLLGFSSRGSGFKVQVLGFRLEFFEAPRRTMSARYSSSLDARTVECPSNLGKRKRRGAGKEMARVRGPAGVVGTWVGGVGLFAAGAAAAAAAARRSALRGERGGPGRA
jgi:hypothetical protein